MKPELYEKDDEQATIEAFVNGLREHADRIHKFCSIVYPLQPKSVLDLGCHFGLFGTLCRWNQQLPKRIVGVDWSVHSCEMARRLGYNEVVMQDVEAFNSEDLFDLVLCTEVLEHIRDPERLVCRALSFSRRHALFSTPIEAEAVDGEFHVRHVRPGELVDWVAKYAKIVSAEVVRSEFCEKPHWLGWTYVLAEVR